MLNAKNWKGQKILKRESTIVVKVIEEKIGNWGLRRHSFQCWMIAQRTGYGVKARIRNAPDSNSPIVVGDIL